MQILLRYNIYGKLTICRNSVKKVFFGRKKELAKLDELTVRNTAALAIIYGRRRIGKSTLVEEFAKGKNFIELYGLPPHKALSNVEQLRHFSFLISQAFAIPVVEFSCWVHCSM